MGKKEENDHEAKERLLGDDVNPQVEPADKFNVVYFIMLIQGVGTLLPWNMFITAHAYFQEKLKANEDLKHSFENYFSVAAMVPNVVMFLINTLFKHKVPLQVRMITSVCIMTLCFILTTVLVVIDTSKWTTDFFYITIGTIILINMSSAIYQGGLFGVCGMMPPRYTGAVMTGQGVGGTFAALASIFSLLGGKDAVSSGFGYFMSAAVVLTLCLFTYIMLNKLKFARHYIASQSRRTEIMSSNNGSEQIERLANWQIPASKQSGNIQHSTLSLDNEALLSVKYHPKEAEAFKNERPPFLLIFRQIFKLASSVAFVFFVTLAAFPSLTSRIQSVHKGDGSEWTETYFVPVTCFLLFNIGDFCGRLAASFTQWPGKDGYLLPVLCFLRVVFLPLFAFCNALPRKNPNLLFFNEDYYPIIFMVLFAISNGYLGSLCMMYGPSMVEPKHAETAGTMMAFMLIIGLGVGAGFSFVITMFL
ncbi:equilibrative nucleoside transporter 1-like isoform X2 [Stylophora pistillata]|uniref:equilibrative nucleoside transporter 1-like isoform X2 n=1 Tax=Stylophora pistillata TaxID=50429 RepID=UPI000C03A923|nr:equilibrative nucleoside transporter 1-like isoform X2 [Stylophora pistillata]